MPLPKPRAGEKQSEFVSRCIEFETKASPGQAADEIQAMCYQAWRDRNKEDYPLPPVNLVENADNDHQKLTEDVSFLNAEFIEDDGHRIIRNVAFLGAQSKHGYTYKQEAMRRAIPLYNNLRCFINHPTSEEEKTGRRNVMSLAGITEGARLEDGKIKGNVKLLDDEYGRKFWNIAHTMPTAASCSHVADGKLVVEDGKRVVDDISEVLSVDLVVQGATTETVFESQQVRNKTMDYSKITMDELKRLRPDLAKALVEEGQKSRDEEVKELTESIDKLKGQVDEFTVKEAQAKKVATVEKLLSESKLTKEAKTQVFREQLLNIESDNFEKEVKSLIEDRQSLLGGVKNMPAKETNGGTQNVNDQAIAIAAAELGI